MRKFGPAILGAVVLTAVGVASPAGSAASNKTGAASEVEHPSTAISVPEFSEPQFIPELSTETSTTMQLPTGEYETTGSTTPVNFLSEEGEWAEIDTAFAHPSHESDAPKQADGGVPLNEVAAENTAAAHTLSVPRDAATTPVRLSTGPSNRWLTIALDGMSGAPALQGSEATYDTVPDADRVVLESTSTGVKETIVLKSAPTEPPVWVYTLRVGQGLEMRQRPGGDIVATPSGAKSDPPAFSLPVGNMFDSTGQDSFDRTASEAYTNKVEYRLTPSHTHPQEYELTVRPDFSWLTSPNRTYPVYIDPDVVASDHRARDCSLWQDQPDTIRCGDQAPYLQVGRASSSADRLRSILYFDILPAIPDDADITNANVQLSFEPGQSLSTSERSYVMQRASKPFTNGATWNSPDNRPSVNPWGAQVSGGGPSGAASTATMINSRGDATWRYFNVTGIVKEWQSGNTANNGLVLKQADETLVSRIAFLSSASANEPGRHPRLNVRYRAADTGGSELPDELPAKMPFLDLDGKEIPLNDAGDPIRGWTEDESLNLGITDQGDTEVETAMLGPCHPVANADRPHWSNGTVSAHGTWDKGTCSNDFANVRNCLFQYHGGIFAWRLKGCGDEYRNLEAGTGGRGNRSTAKVNCQTDAGTGWANVVDVDVRGEWDDKKKGRRVSPVLCRVP